MKIQAFRRQFDAPDPLLASRSSLRILMLRGTVVVAAVVLAIGVAVLAVAQTTAPSLPDTPEKPPAPNRLVTQPAPAAKPVVALSAPISSVAANDAPPAPKPDAPAPLPPVSSTPEHMTANFGDWVMRCDRAGGAAKPTCEVALVLTQQGQNSPFAQVAIVRPGAAEPRRITVMLPAVVSIVERPRMVARVGATPIELVWQRCQEGACIATAAITDSALSQMSAATEPGKLLFKDASGQNIILPLSVRGLQQALAALPKE